METVTEGKVVIQVINESKLTMVIILSASSLAASLMAVLISVLVLASHVQLKKEVSNSKPKSGKKEHPKMEEFTTRINTFHTYTSPIYNPYFSEEKDDM